MLSTADSIIQGAFFIMIGSFFLRGVPRILERGITRGTFQPSHRGFLRWFRLVGWFVFGAGALMILMTLIFDVWIKG